MDGTAEVSVSEAKYVYCIIESKKPQSFGRAGVGGRNDEVYTVHHGELAAVGLITSLIVDNQIVDLDRPNRLLQYHAVSVPKGSSVEKAAAVNRPVEELLKGVSRTGRDA